MSDCKTIRSFGCSGRSRKAFTLVELLVVVAIISLLLAVILPSLRKVRRQAQLLVCSTNLHNVSLAVHAYAHDFDDTIPFGPEGLPMAGSNFYTATGNVTSLLSVYDGSPVGLGLLLDGYLADQPKVLFCPGVDQHSDADAQLARVGKKQAQSDYYYRHASVAMLSGEPEAFHVRLGDLGKNRNGTSIAALVMDVQFLANPSLSVFGVVTRTSHHREAVNILLSDGQVVRQDNTENQFTVDIGGYPYDALDKILAAFERADELR